MMRACLCRLWALRRGGLLSYGRSGRLRRGALFSPKAQSGETRSRILSPMGRFSSSSCQDGRSGRSVTASTKPAPDELTGEGLGDSVHHGFGADQETVPHAGRRR